MMWSVEKGGNIEVKQLKAKILLYSWEIKQGAAVLKIISNGIFLKINV